MIRDALGDFCLAFECVAAYSTAKSTVDCSVSDTMYSEKGYKQIRTEYFSRCMVYPAKVLLVEKVTNEKKLLPI